MSISRVQRGGLQVAEELDQLVANQVIPGTGVDLDGFWASFEACLNELGPVNKQLLKVRDEMQEKLDAWHLARKGQVFDEVEYKEFLQAIDYLLPEPEGVKIDVTNVDVEIASIAGPQLVMHLMQRMRAGAVCTMRFTAPTLFPKHRATRKAKATTQHVAN